jgi:hypothetical protein
VKHRHVNVLCMQTVADVGEIISLQCVEARAAGVTSYDLSSINWYPGRCML